MRIAPAFLCAALLLITACKEQAADTLLGKYQVTVDGEKTEYESYSNAKTGVLDVYTTSANNIRIVTVRGHANSNSAQAPFPRLVVTLIKNHKDKPYNIASILFTTTKGGNAYRSLAPGGNQTLTNFSISDSGEIGFDFSADLVQQEKGEYGRKVVEGVPIIHIKGSYSGSTIQ